MFQRRQTRVLLALLVVAAVTLITLDFRGGEDGVLERGRDLATAVLRPLQDGVGTLLSPFSAAGGAISDLFGVRSENQALRARVEALEERRRVIDDLERENAELRGLLDMADRTELETVAARVVALSPSNFEWTITIDVGSDDGLARGMPVVDGDGLIGRVIQVTPTASRVLLTIDPSFSAAARTGSTGEVGVIDGRGGDPMVLRLLDPEAEIEEGEAVVTSSYRGGVFPPGIPLGTVSSIEEGATPLTREVLVNPYVDFTRLHHVVVVFSTGIDEIPPFEGSEGLDFTRPPVPPLLDPDTVPGAEDDAADADGDDDDSDDDEEGAAGVPGAVGVP